MDDGDEVFCPWCGYDLRGVGEVDDGVAVACSECGRPVRLDWLRRAVDRWPRITGPPPNAVLGFVALFVVLGSFILVFVLDDPGMFAVAFVGFALATVGWYVWRLQFGDPRYRYLTRLSWPEYGMMVLMGSLGTPDLITPLDVSLASWLLTILCGVLILCSIGAAYLQGWPLGRRRGVVHRYWWIEANER